MESYLDGIISRTRRDQEMAEIAEKSAAAAALLKQEPAPPAPALTREDVAALALVLAEYAFLEREAKRVMLEALTPRIYVRKYAVVGVELPTTGPEGNSRSGVASAPVQRAHSHGP